MLWSFPKCLLALRDGNWNTKIQYAAGYFSLGENTNDLQSKTPGNSEPLQLQCKMLCYSVHVICLSSRFKHITQCY